MNFESESKFLLENSAKIDTKFDENSSFLPFGRSTNMHQLDLFYSRTNNSLIPDDHLLSSNRGIIINPIANLNSNNLELSRSLALPKPDEHKNMPITFTIPNNNSTTTIPHVQNNVSNNTNNISSNATNGAETRRTRNKRVSLTFFNMMFNSFIRIILRHLLVPNLMALPTKFLCTNL